MTPKYKGMKKTTRYKHITKMRRHRGAQESIVSFQPGSYRDIQEILKVSPNTISEAFKNQAKYSKSGRPRGWNLRKGQYAGDLGRRESKYGKRS